MNAYDYDLPEGLLMKILETLDSKTLCRLRLVSKGWNLIISNPIFIRPYISSFTTMATTRSLPWTILRQDSCYIRERTFRHGILRFNRVYSDRINPSLIVSVLRFPISVSRKPSWVPFHHYRVLASSHGLLLCSVNFTFYVCNPVIQQWVPIPYHLQCHISLIGGLVARVDEVGVVTSYKVALLRKRNKDGVVDIGIFDSDIGTWTTYRPDIRFPAIDIGFRPICFNGILHFHGLGQLIAYDPYTDACQWRSISLPSTSMCSLHGFLCGVSKGRLSCIFSSGDRIQVWVLEDYGTSEWLLKYTYIERCSIVYPPCAFHPFDPTIIHTRIVTRIFAYDLVRNYRFMVCDIGLNDLSRFDVLPFVLPPWPALVPEPSW